MPRYPKYWYDPRLPHRFWEKVRIDHGGKRTNGAVCWLWIASLTSGYGQSWTRRIDGSKTAISAHKLLYITLIGPVPPFVPGGPQLDHLCRVRRCVNPRHLELVPSGWENMARWNPAIRRLGETGLCTRGHVWRATKSGGCAECAAVVSALTRARCREARELLGMTWTEYRAVHGESRAVAERIIKEHEGS